MNAIDTNVLVRFLVGDDDVQAKKALNYITGNENIFISLIVLCETAWVLASCYDINKTELVKVLEKILRTQQFTVENSKVAWQTLYALARNGADFSDYLIGFLSKHYECEEIVTFDKDAARTDLFELLV